VRYRTRLFIFFGLICFFCFAVVPARLFQLQVLNKNYYTEMVEQRSIRTDPVDAPRGKITTADGVVLGFDSPAYDLQILFRAIKDGKATAAKLAEALREPEKAVAQRLDDLRQTIVAERLTEARRETAAGIRLVGFRYKLAERLRLKPGSLPKLEAALPEGVSLEQRRVRKYVFLKQWVDEYDLCIDYSRLESVSNLAGKLAGMLPVQPKALVERLAQSEETLHQKVLSRWGPCTLLINLPFETLVRVAALEPELPCIQIACRPVRRYPQGALAGQILGSIGEPGEEHLRKWLWDSENVWIRRWARSGVKPQSNDFFYRSLNDELAKRGLELEGLVGRSGLEYVFEEQLRGTKGQRLVERDSRNQVQDVLGESPSCAGNSVVLTIDGRLQRIAEAEFERETGAAVFMDVHTGTILAAASLPLYDPNELVPPVSRETADRLFRNPQRPTLNRAFSSYYPLGSIFKVLTSVCALEEGTVSPNTEINCQGPMSPSQPDWFRCWARHGHGALTIRQALQHSCNVFYYTCADRGGHEPILKWAQVFEFGARPGSEFQEFESSGLLPTAEWKRLTLRESWHRGDTRNLAIGQGYLTVSPLQVVRMMAAIANGGVLPPVRLVKELVNEDGRRIPFGKDISVRPARRIRISAGTLSTIGQGLQDVVNTPAGTAYKAFKDAALPYQVAGKTSTAQTGRPEGNVGWFAGYFPAQKPEIAFAVVVEGLRRASSADDSEEHGGDVAGPIVRRILERYETEKEAPVTASVVKSEK
jgi:penicillin-binding protein 2